MKRKTEASTTGFNYDKLYFEFRTQKTTDMYLKRKQFPNSEFYKLIKNFTKLSYYYLLTKLTPFKTLRSSSWVLKKTYLL